MADSRTKNSARNLITGFLLKCFSLLLPFVVRTIIIKKLGMEYLGLNSLFSSVLQFLSLTELGLSTSIAFALYKPVKDDDVDKICALLNMLRKTYYVIGAVILIAGIAVAPFLPHLINGSYPSDINLYVLFFIYLFNTVISYFLFSYKSVFLTAIQRSDVENNIAFISLLFMYVAQIVVLLLIPNYYVYIIFLPVSTLLMNLIREFVCRRKYPKYIAKGNLQKSEKKEIYAKIKSLTGHRLCGTLVSSTDSIFISAFLGLTPLAQYTNYFYIVSACMGFSAVFFSSITASVGNSIACETKEHNYRLFLNLTYVNVWIIGWMSITMMSLFQSFMLMWVGEENMLPTLTAFLLTIYFYTWKSKDILVTFKDAAGMWDIDFWKPYVVAFLNIGLDFLLVYYIGIDGVIIATILSVPVVSFPWETNAFFKHYFQRSPRNYYLRLLVYTIVVAAAGCLTYYVCSFVPTGEKEYGYFVLRFLICLTLPNLIIVISSFWTQEFKWVFGKGRDSFNKIIHRNNTNKSGVSSPLKNEEKASATSEAFDELIETDGNNRNGKVP